MLMSGEKAIQILLRDGTLSGVMVVESAAWENGVIYSVKAFLLAETVENPLGRVLLLLPAILGFSACKGPASRVPGASPEASVRSPLG